MSKHVATSLSLMTEQWLDISPRPTLWTDNGAEDRALDPAVMEVVQLGRSIESDVTLFNEWFRTSPIWELGGLTAQELVARGDSTMVIEFLLSITRNERGQ